MPLSPVRSSFGIPFSPGLVCCFMGTLGSGKTLDMTYQAYRLWRSRGVQVYVNYDCAFGSRIQSIPHLTRVRNGLLLIDEMQALLDSRDFKGNVDITQWLLLIRKLGLSLFYTTQHISFVDKRLRQITDLILVHEKPLAARISTTRVHGFRPFGDVANHIGTSLLHHEKWMYGLYDTKDIMVALTMDGYASPFNFESKEEQELDRATLIPASPPRRSGAVPPGRST